MCWSLEISLACYWTNAFSYSTADSEMFLSKTISHNNWIASLISPFVTVKDNPITSLSKVIFNYPPKLAIASSNWCLFFFSVPLRKRLVSNLALPEEFKFSNLEPALKKMETVFSLEVYFSVIIYALLLREVWLKTGDDLRSFGISPIGSSPNSTSLSLLN